MACKTCNERLEALVGLEADRNQEKRRADFNNERAHELQEACARYKEEASTLQGRLRAREKEVESLWLTLKDELKKSSAHELLRLASEAAQIAKLSANAFPEGGPVADAASSVALGALKQVRERLEGDVQADT